MIGPRHIPYGDWLQQRYDEIARLSLNAGITLAQTREAAVIHARLQRAVGDASMADVIPFPGVMRDA